MAPDRGQDSEDRETEISNPATQEERCAPLTSSHESPSDHRPSDSDPENARLALARQRSDARRFLASHASEGQNFTLRGVVVGLAIGVIVCFSNTYFGLQTGWVSGMAMPSSLIGFAFFKTISRHLDLPFTPVENVLVQTVAGALGTMPLGCGFVGVMPALNYLLKKEENGPLELGTGRLIVWSLGICLFGVVFAVPLRREVIIRERLKFPSGTATALMIGVLHGGPDGKDYDGQNDDSQSAGLLAEAETSADHGAEAVERDNAPQRDTRDDWKAKIRLLVIAFIISAFYTLSSYFIPQLRDVPILGLPLARTWLWTLNPSPAYVGQGIIMGPATTLHMLLGAVIGWGILSPLAKYKGWAPGPVNDWETGSKGWIVWVSLAIMLADSVINLGWLLLRPLIFNGPRWFYATKSYTQSGKWRHVFNARNGYSAVGDDEPSTPLTSNSGRRKQKDYDEFPEVDAPPDQLVSNRHVVVALALTLVFCVICIHLTFGSLVPLYAILLAVLLALVLSVMGVRALGETDLNPVSGISKLTQLVFAFVVPSTNPNTVIINLIAGAVSESGALQAGDMMQDLKTGHLLGASPKAQYYGQLIGSVAGAFISAFVYKLYTSVYTIPGGLFEVPTAYVWVFTARLVTGKGLPNMAWQWAVGAGTIFALGTMLRIRGQWTSWQCFIPGGIAVAVGKSRLLYPERRALLLSCSCADKMLRQKACTTSLHLL
jgi:OPT family oligopeptide transporter